jgi:RNA polymerase sigma factor (sigma-70 family)
MAVGQLNKVIQHLRAALERQDAVGLPDAVLLKRYAHSQDEAAFETLVRRHGPMVFGVCRRVLHNAHDAEDAFQATFLVLVRKAAALRSPGMIGNWLYGVAYRTALHARDAALKRRAKEAEMAPRTQAAEDAWSDLRLALDRELERLPDKYRAVIVLCDLEGKTRKETARQLGWAEGTVASRLVRGRRMLAKRLARHGAAVSGGALVVVLAEHATAAVPSCMVSSTVKAAALFAAGKAAASAGISVPLAALTEGALKSMLLNKLKTALLVMAFFIYGGSAALCLHSLGAQGPPGGKDRAASGDRRDQAQTAAAENPIEGASSAARKKTLTDRYGDALPEGALVRLGTIRFRLGNGIYNMALAPDGQTAVSVGGNAWTQFWDVATGKEVRRIEWKQGGGGRVVAYSPDGRLVATVQDHGVASSLGIGHRQAAYSAAVKDGFYLQSGFFTRQHYPGRRGSFEQIWPLRRDHERQRRSSMAMEWGELAAAVGGQARP